MLNRTKAELNKIASLDKEWIRLGANHLMNKRGYFIFTLNSEDVDYICDKKSYTEMDAGYAEKFMVGLSDSSITLRRTNLLHRTTNGYIELLLDENNNLYGFNERYNVLLKKDWTYDICTAGRDKPLHFTTPNTSEHIIILPIHLKDADGLKGILQSMKA